MKSHRASIFTKLVILILIVYAVITLINLSERINKVGTEQKELQAQRDELRRSNEYLQYEMEHSNDESTLAEIARSKLGLVLPGERVFYDISN